MEMMIERTAGEAEKYELKSDGIVVEIEDKLFMIVTYGPENRYYLADIHANRIVAAINMLEGCKCVLAYDEKEGWRIDTIEKNGEKGGSIRLCRTGIDLKAMGIDGGKRTAGHSDVPRFTASDFKEAIDHGTDSRRDRDLRQNDKRA
jgi:hypothetical protein